MEGNTGDILASGLHGVTPLRGLDVPPARVPDTGRFGRLFPNLPAFEPPVDPLIALGARGGPMNAGSDIQPSKTVAAGFTYFGQFLDHNITFDADSRLDHVDDPQATTNFRSGRIDLEHVYGLGPTTQGFVYYDSRPDRVGKFWLDENRPWDVPRNEQQTALIADPRNDNTVITTQIHLAFMRFHNAVVDHLAPQLPPGADLFESARQLVIWHYQWLVLHEWLPLIVKPAVYDDIAQNGLRYYTWSDRPYIPVEFNVAAYRLHTLVLESYQLNQNRQGILFDLRKPFQALPVEDAIDWSYFFDFGDGKVQYAKRFEAKIVDTFLNMPGPIDNPLDWPFALPPTPELRSIAVRNLLRARAFELPSGQTVAARLGLTPLTQEELGLADSGLAEAPLWYYVLKEAELDAGGVTLGDVGSRIVGEVLTGLVKGDPTSYLNVAPSWTPTLGRDGQFTMTDLLTFAGVHPAGG